MMLWLDDIRNPEDFSHSGWTWAKSADEAIAYLKTGKVTVASLDHDLSWTQMQAGMNGKIVEDGEKTGYDVVVWLEENPEYFPPLGVRVHSMNPAGRKRMEQVINKIKKNVV